MSGYMEEVFERLKYPHASAHPEYEVSCQGYQLDLHCRFACALSRPANSGESCIALESRLTHSLVAKLSQRSLLAFVLQSRNASYL